MQEITVKTWQASGRGVCAGSTLWVLVYADECTDTHLVGRMEYRGSSATGSRLPHPVFSDEKASYQGLSHLINKMVKVPLECLEIEHRGDNYTRYKYDGKKPIQIVGS